MPKHPIVYGTCLLVGAMCYIALAQGNFDEASVRLSIRLTAATSFMLLLCTFIAKPLLQLTGIGVSRALLRLRRQFGISVGISHSLHLAMIFLLVPIAFDNDLSKLGSVSDNLAGIVLYVLLYAMTVTSNNTSQRLLGKNWVRLHRLGSYALILAFTGAYLRNALDLGGGYYWLLGSLGGLALILRLLNWRQSRLANQSSIQVPITH